MAKIIEAGSALDWYTIRQVCEAAARELLEANPREPKAGRIDLYREVTIDGRRCMVRIKLTLSYASR